MVALTELLNENASDLPEQFTEQLAAPREAVCAHFREVMEGLAAEQVQRGDKLEPKYSPNTVLAACDDFRALVFNTAEEPRTNGRVRQLVREYYALVFTASQGSGLLRHYDWCDSYRPRLTSQRLHDTRQAILPFLQTQPS